MATRLLERASTGGLDFGGGNNRNWRKRAEQPTIMWIQKPLPASKFQPGDAVIHVRVNGKQPFKDDECVATVQSCIWVGDQYQYVLDDGYFALECTLRRTYTLHDVKAWLGQQRHQSALRRARAKVEQPLYGPINQKQFNSWGRLRQHGPPPPAFRIEAKKPLRIKKSVNID